LRVRKRLVPGTIALACAAAVIAAAVVLAARPHPAARAVKREAVVDPVAAALAHPHPTAAEPVAGAGGGGQAPPLASFRYKRPKWWRSLPQPKPPPLGGDAALRAELAEVNSATLAGPGGSGPLAGGAGVGAGGIVKPPGNAPATVARIIDGGNQIAGTPYVWGGGHGRWIDRGYDCSGSVSFALASAGLLRSPLTSGEFAAWGDPGPGRWVTIYANDVHVWMVVAGHRFDTGGLAVDGSRWHAAGRGTGGFAARHPPGL
jgi:cell wall-associated NlpC family hydrolase